MRTSPHLSRAVGNGDEFVARKTSDQIAAGQNFAQASRRFLKDLIAGSVAQAVVDRLEAVEIDQQNSKRLILA